MLHQGQRLELNADAEIVLSAGALNSPQLLMLSELGPASIWRRLGIFVVADMPGVGANLQDHPTVSITD